MSVNFQSDGGGISFPLDGPAFDLPEGCSCNSVEANIVDNVWQGVEAPPATITVSGTISTDCEGPKAFVTVVVVDADGKFVCAETGCPLTNGLGQYSVSGIASSPNPGTVKVIAPVGYTSPDPIPVSLNADQVVDAELTCVYTTVSGIVESGCGGGPVSGATVSLTPQGGDLLSVITAADGSFSFSNLRASAGMAELGVTHPSGYEPFPAAPGGEGSVIDITSDQTGIIIPLVCLPVDVTGTVSALDSLGEPCSGGMLGITVDLDHPGGEMFTTTTDANGNYSFLDLPATAESAVIAMVPPLGFLADDPANGQALAILNLDREVNFTMTCKDPTGEARAMGYWKHQANVYLKNKGHAHETEAEMTINYPTQIFNHFFENGLNAIEVEGVTYMDIEGARVPIDLATIHATLSVKGNAGMEAKAKQQYLALLLNLAAGKLLPSSIVSVDQGTASQTLQQVAALINDSNAANDEVAKDICDEINNAQVVAAGVIDLEITTIAYRPGSGDTPTAEGLHLGQNHPNPFNPMTKIQFVVDRDQFVDLSIYNTAGRLVQTLVHGHLTKGTYVEEWHGRDSHGEGVGTGVYFYRLNTAEETLTRKMILMK